MHKTKLINKPKPKTTAATLFVVFLVTIVIMTIYEWIKEFYFKGALTPWESHTITIFVTAILATSACYFIRSSLIKIYQKEKLIEKNEVALKSFKLVLPAVNHIVNNVLNYLNIIECDLDKDNRINDESMAALRTSIEEAKAQMQILNEIELPDDPASYKDIYPHL